ncbi:MAG: histidinol-phosphate transaminase [Kiritimatiellae bacterium]|nr:histidinol-phosphate transaminase [Kiritimatiellia bacterium]
MRIAKSVQALTPYTPGEQPKSRSVIKLNTNENPYAPSPLVGKVLASFDLDRLRRYPDPVFAELRKKIAERDGAAPDCVFVGNGSDEVLTLAARAFVDDGEAIGSFDPSYSLYKTLAAIRNVPFVPSPLAEDFTWTEPVVQGGEHPVALFLLTNPNAPTSVRYPCSRVEAFARTFPGVVLVDEAYADFADDTCMPLAAAPDNRNVVVMRTLSKSFSLAGLRLGYCVGPADLVDALYKVKDSYNVDALAQAVALAALSDLPWMKSNAAKVCKTRDATAAALRARGWDVPPSQANFLFARPAHRPAAEIFAELRKRDIFVRYFPGPRTGDRLRISVGTDADMAALLDALADLDRI